MTEENKPTPTSSSTGSPVGPLAQAAPGPCQLRNELEELVVRELLGPRGGPDEEVTENRLQDRYLVGMLAPKNKLDTHRPASGNGYMQAKATLTIPRWRDC